jgi:hypothetical protein
MGTHGEQVRTAYEQNGEQFGNIIRNLLLNGNTDEHKLATHELEKETPPPTPSLSSIFKVQPNTLHIPQKASPLWYESSKSDGM